MFKFSEPTKRELNVVACAALVGAIGLLVADLPWNAAVAALISVVFFVNAWRVEKSSDADTEQ